MVAGGPYGTEEIVGKAGYSGALLILILTPLLWSLPTALMVSELSSTLPEEGGFYAWVTRAMGPFWGYQEAWLSLAGSLFDMAIYPTLFVYYLSHFLPSLASGSMKNWLGLGLIAVCTIWNIFGARAVGTGSVLFTAVVLGPFVVLIVLAIFHHSAAGVSHAALGHADILGGVLIAMWNLMGWDNVSTVAGEVERPQRTYPLAMAAAVTLVVVSYLAPIVAVARTGISPNEWTTGGWVDLGRMIGGGALAGALALGGVLGSIGSFNALMLSLTRLPMVMTEDGYLPRIFARRSARTGAPWVAIVACAIGWAACFQLGFVPLVVLDVLLTGFSVLLEFWALVALRIREPGLHRPYRVPGGITGAVLLAIGPTALMVLAIVRNHAEQAWSFNALSLGAVLIGLGPLLYFLSRRFGRVGARG
jgi:amino acid transporter